MGLCSSKKPKKPSACGGKTPCGEPAIPDIGDKPVKKLPNGDLKVGKNLVITGSDEYKKKVLADLTKIAKTNTGKALLDEMDKGKYKTTIKELDIKEANKYGALAGPTKPDDAKDPKKGSGTTIKYNPDVKKKVTDEGGKKHDWPAESILAHEMIHAVHNASGNNLKDKPDPKDVTGNQEESQTIGINDHQDDTLTENKLLSDMGVGWQRTDHDLSAKTTSKPSNSTKPGPGKSPPTSSPSAKSAPQPKPVPPPTKPKSKTKP